MYAIPEGRQELSTEPVGGCCKQDVTTDEAMWNLVDKLVS